MHIFDIFLYKAMHYHSTLPPLIDGHFQYTNTFMDVSVLEVLLIFHINIVYYIVLCRSIHPEKKLKMINHLESDRFIKLVQFIICSAWAK